MFNFWSKERKSQFFKEPAYTSHPSHDLECNLHVWSILFLRSLWPRPFISEHYGNALCLRLTILSQDTTGLNNTGLLHIVHFCVWEFLTDVLQDEWTGYGCSVFWNATIVSIRNCIYLETKWPSEHTKA